MVVTFSFIAISTDDQEIVLRGVTVARPHRTAAKADSSPQTAVTCCRSRRTPTISITQLRRELFLRPTAAPSDGAQLRCAAARKRQGYEPGRKPLDLLIQSAGDGDQFVEATFRVRFENKGSLHDRDAPRIFLENQVHPLVFGSIMAGLNMVSPISSGMRPDPRERRPAWAG